MPVHPSADSYSWTLSTAAHPMLGKNRGTQNDIQCRFVHHHQLSQLNHHSEERFPVITRVDGCPLLRPMSSSREPFLPGSCLDRCRGVRDSSRSHGLTHLKQPAGSAPLIIITLDRRDSSPWSGVWRLMGCEGAHGLWMTGRLRSPHLFKGACSSKRAQCPRSEGNCRPHAS